MILYRSTNHGSTWTKAKTADPAERRHVRVHRPVERRLPLQPRRKRGKRSAPGRRLEVDRRRQDVDVREERRRHPGRQQPVRHELPAVRCRPPVGRCVHPERQDDEAGAWCSSPTTTSTARATSGRTSPPTAASRTALRSTSWPNFTSAAASQAAVALANSSCSTVPIGAGIAWAGKHPGRFYVAWLASDPESRGHRLQRDAAAGVPRHLRRVLRRSRARRGPRSSPSTRGSGTTPRPRSRRSPRRQGQPVRRLHRPGAEATTRPSAPTESSAGTVQSDTTCSYNMWVVWSPNGGSDVGRRRRDDPRQRRAGVRG